MKNTKRFSVLAALAMGLVIAAGAFVVPAMSYASEHADDKTDHKEGDKEGHAEHDGHGHE